MPIDDIMRKAQGVQPPGATAGTRPTPSAPSQQRLSRFRISYDAITSKIKLDKEKTNLLASVVSIVVNIFRLL